MVPQVVPRLALSALGLPAAGHAGPPTARSVRWSEDEAQAEPCATGRSACSSFHQTPRTPRFSPRCAALPGRCKPRRRSFRTNLFSDARQRRKAGVQGPSDTAQRQGSCGRRERSLRDSSSRLWDTTRGSRSPRYAGCTSRECSSHCRSDRGDSIQDWAAEAEATPRAASVPSTPRLPSLRIPRRLGTPTPRTRRACCPGAGAELAASLVQRRRTVEGPLQTFDMATDEEADVPAAALRSQPSHVSHVLKMLQTGMRDQSGETSLEVLELRLDLERIVQQVVRSEVAAVRHDIQDSLQRRRRSSKKLKRASQDTADAAAAQPDREETAYAFAQHMDELTHSLEELRRSQEELRQEVSALLSNGSQKMPMRLMKIEEVDTGEAIWSSCKGADRLLRGDGDSLGAASIESEAESEELIPASEVEMKQDLLHGAECDPRGAIAEVHQELCELKESFFAALELKADATVVDDTLQDHEAWMEELASWLQQLRDREEAVRELLRAALPGTRGQELHGLDTPGCSTASGSASCSGMGSSGSGSSSRCSE